jgi:hypothetical protein
VPRHARVDPAGVRLDVMFDPQKIEQARGAKKSNTNFPQSRDLRKRRNRGCGEVP